MSVENERELARATVELMKVGGAAFYAFATALTARADELTDKYIGAHGADIHRLQGAVQEARALLDELAKAPKLMEDLRNQERASSG